VAQAPALMKPVSNKGVYCMDTLDKIVFNMHKFLMPTMGIAFVLFTVAAHADDLTVTYKLEDVASCTTLAAVQSDPRPFGGALNGMVKDMTTQATAMHADTLLVLKHHVVFSVLKGVAYRCVK
jgi:hypothetical protein